MNHVMFLALHLQLCNFDLADRCEAVCIARQSPGGHTCAEGSNRAPSSSSIWHKLPITQNLSSPSTFPPPVPSPPHPSPGKDWMDTPTFTQAPLLFGGTPKSKREWCANLRDHPFYYGMAPPQHSIKLFIVEIRPNSGSIPSYDCQDHIEKHLAGWLEALGSAVQEIHFQPRIPGSRLQSWSKCQASRQNPLSLEQEGDSSKLITRNVKWWLCRTDM